MQCSRNSASWVSSLTKSGLANTLEACFSMPRERKLALIDDGLEALVPFLGWVECGSAQQMPHLRLFSTMESLMWCKVLVFQQCLHAWNWYICSVALSENNILAFILSQERWRGSSPHSSRVWWLSSTKTSTALITIWLRWVLDFSACCCK